MEKIKVGDLVKIKSGSPEMVVISMGFKKSGFPDSSKCICEWFNEGIVKTSQLSINGLIKV